jgi:sugar phosphate isomerase/epimerase
MKIEQVAAQLYTLRDHLKTPQQIANALRRVRKIGYEAVQIAGLGPIENSELAKILDGEGLICCSSHENSETILTSPEAVAEKLNILGCTYTAYPYPRDVDMGSMRSVRTLARQLSNAGRVLSENGKVLAYHNHELEFTRIRNRTVMEILLAESDPRYLQVELDVHWAQAGGVSPEGWCRKLKGRLPVIHLKDYAVTPDRKRVFAEVGSGNLNWPEIIRDADASGCSWFVVEQDGDWLDNDPFRSLRQSFTYIREKLAD